MENKKIFPREQTTKQGKIALEGFIRKKAQMNYVRDAQDP